MYIVLEGKNIDIKLMQTSPKRRASVFKRLNYFCRSKAFREILKFKIFECTDPNDPSLSQYPFFSSIRSLTLV